MSLLLPLLRLSRKGQHEWQGQLQMVWQPCHLTSGHTIRLDIRGLCHLLAGFALRRPSEAPVDDDRSSQNRPNFGDPSPSQPTASCYFRHSLDPLFSNQPLRLHRISENTISLVSYVSSPSGPSYPLCGCPSIFSRLENVQTKAPALPPKSCQGDLYPITHQPHIKSASSLAQLVARSAVTLIPPTSQDEGRFKSIPEG